MVLGIWGEWLFIFRELGSTGNHFRGSGEPAHSFGDLGSPAKLKKKLTSILFDFLKILCFRGGLMPPDPLIKCNSTFTCTSRLIEEKIW